jgi:DNA ligase-1
MRQFAQLLDRLALEPRRNSKIALIVDYLQATPDPERGWALAVLTRSLDFPNAKPAMLRQLISERTDPVLFKLSRDYVGDMSETIALMWPADRSRSLAQLPDLTSLITHLQKTPKADIQDLISTWLDTMNAVERWALLKMLTGGLRIGVSERLAKTAVAALGSVPIDEIEHLWHGQSPPFTALLQWAEGKGAKPFHDPSILFSPPMLAHALTDTDLEKLDPSDFYAEWKWSGIRVQALCGYDDAGQPIKRLYSRTGEDISAAFPDILNAFDWHASVDGELLIIRDGQVQSFNQLQQRLNRKTVTPQLLKDYPAGLRLYDLLSLKGRDQRHRPFLERRQQLETLMNKTSSSRFSLSGLIDFHTWEELKQARHEPTSFGMAKDGEAIEGVMLKLKTSPYVPGRPKGPWWKWKKDPMVIDAVLMYAQRGSGKRSSFYSDFTFGVWKENELVPVGKAYFGFTDAELKKLDHFVRHNTVDRFGPVRAVRANKDTGMVLEIAFEGLARSKRHKSGLAMRFPRIHRIRWDKPPHEADHLAALEQFLA